MPSSYTAPIEEDKPFTFKEFALRCAREFGALVTERDERLDKPIPQVIKPDPFYYERMQRSFERLNKAIAMTLEEAEREQREEVLRYSVEMETSKIKQLEKWQRYQAMLAEVKAWKAPTMDHVSLQLFMERQIEDSCRHLDPAKALLSQYTYPVLSPTAYKEREVAMAARQYAKDQEAWEKEQERALEQTEWIQDLYKSLG